MVERVPLRRDKADLLLQPFFRCDRHALSAPENPPPCKTDAGKELLLIPYNESATAVNFTRFKAFRSGELLALGWNGLEMKPVWSIPDLLVYRRLCRRFRIRGHSERSLAADGKCGRQIRPHRLQAAVICRDPFRIAGSASHQSRCVRAPEKIISPSMARFRHSDRIWVEPFFNGIGHLAGQLLLLLPGPWRRRIHIWMCVQMAQHAPESFPEPASVIKRKQLSARGRCISGPASGRRFYF